jgi:spermidine synthase
MPRIFLNTYPFTMTELLKPAKSGEFELTKSIIPEGREINFYDRDGRIFKGKYAFDYPVVILKQNETAWMSDSQLEIGSLEGAVSAAKGNCLISGLGIGLLPTLIGNLEVVRSIDIVELNQEVIDIVFHQIDNGKTNIIKGDIYSYLENTDKKYDFIHIDIWKNLTATIKEIERAREIAQRCLNPDGIVWCWLQELYDRIKGKLPKTPVSPGRVKIYEPCLICGKTVRYDYAGLCVGCATGMGVNEQYLNGKKVSQE